MIIVSQDKKETTQSLELFICCENINKYSIIVCKRGMFATYKTEERAKEVLQEIVKIYKGNFEIWQTIDEIEFNRDISEVYEMPIK